MNIVLDAGGVSALARSRERLRQLRDRTAWPPVVPAVVLVETLTGDHRRDFHQNRLLRLCAVPAVDAELSRRAAALRSASARRHASAVDAIVVATADKPGGSVVLSSDPSDLRALASHTTHPVRVEQT